MVCRRYTDKYAVQAWIIALSSTVSCLIGFGEIAVGVWLILHNVRFIGIVGQKVIDLYYAYVAAGAFASITALFGLVASFLRRRCMLLLYISLLLLSVVDLCVVWTLFYIEQKKILALLPNRLHSDNSSQYYEFIDHHYNCQLQNASSVQRTFKHQLQLCADFILRQSWSRVYGILALCAFLICLQITIVLMSAVLSKLLKGVDASVHPVLPENSRNHTTTMQDEERREGSSQITQKEERVTCEGSTIQLIPVPPTTPSPFPSPSTSPPMPPSPLPPPPPVDFIPLTSSHFPPVPLSSTPFPPAPLPPALMPPALLPPAPLPPAPLPPAPLPPAPLPPAPLPPASLSPASLPPSPLPPASLSPASLPPAPLPPASLSPASLPPSPLPPALLPPALLSPSHMNSNVTVPPAYDGSTQPYNNHYTYQQSWSPHDNYYRPSITKL